MSALDLKSTLVYEGDIGVDHENEYILNDPLRGARRDSLGLELPNNQCGDNLSQASLYDWVSINPSLPRPL